MVETIDKKDLQIVRGLKFSNEESQSKTYSSMGEDLLVRTSILAMKGIVFSVCYHNFEIKKAKEIQLIIFNQLEDIEKIDNRNDLLKSVKDSYHEFDLLLRSRIEKHFEENTSRENIDELKTVYGKHLKDLEGDPSVTKSVSVQ